MVDAVSLPRHVPDAVLRQLTKWIRNGNIADYDIFTANVRTCTKAQAYTRLCQAYPSRLRNNWRKFHTAFYWCWYRRKPSHFGVPDEVHSRLEFAQPHICRDPSNDTFWFFDESEAYGHGPYSTLVSCEEALAAYCEQINSTSTTATITK